MRTASPGALTRGFGPPPVCPPLGLLHLSAWLRERVGGVQVRVVDAAVDMERVEDLGRILDEFRPETVGLSGLTNETTLFARMAATVRRSRERACIVAGGPIASSDPEGVLAQVPEVDVAVVGEGERTFVELVRARMAGAGAGAVRGVCHRDERGRPHRTPRRAFIDDLDELPRLDWGEVRLDAYGRVYNFNDLPVLDGRYVPLFTSRGCPYRCTFCHGHFGRRTRGRDVELVADEMAHDVRRWGVREFHIVDDIFNYRRGRVKAFHDALRARRLDVRLAFPNGVRGDRLTDRDIALLSEAGCRSMSLALETLTPRFESMIRKNLDVEKVMRAAEVASRHGILTRCFVMLGFPGETLEEMKRAMERLASSAFDLVHIFPVAPNPGTELFDLAVEAGWDPRRWHGSEYDYDKCFVNASGLPDEVFSRFLDRARLYPYTRPDRRARLRDRYASLGFAGHPMFVRSAHWRLALGEVLERDAPASA